MTTQNPNQADANDYEDQDAEPSLKAPGDAGPTGVTADGADVDDTQDTGEGDGTAG